MENTQTYWKKILEQIFGTREYKKALAQTEDQSTISSKHVPILIFYPTKAGRPRDCNGVCGVRTNPFDREHYQIEIWYSRENKDYAFYTTRQRFSQVVMIPPSHHSTRGAMRYDSLVMTDKKDTKWATKVTYIARTHKQEELHG